MVGICNDDKFQLISSIYGNWVMATLNNDYSEMMFLFHLNSESKYALQLIIILIRLSNKSK